MSEQTHSPESQSQPAEQWRVIALVGDQYFRDIDIQMKDFDFFRALSDKPDDVTVKTYPDPETNCYYFDCASEATSQKVAIERSMMTVVDSVRAIGLTDTEVRFARISPVAALAVTSNVGNLEELLEALDNMNGISIEAAMAERKAKEKLIAAARRG